MKHILTFLTLVALTTQMACALAGASTTTTQPLGFFCSNLDKIFATVDKTLQLRLEKNILLTPAGLSKPNILIGNIDAKRVEITALRKSISAELARRATTQDHKKAIDVFLTQIESSATKKDKDIQTIITQSQTEADQILSKTIVSIQEATTTYHTAINKAKEQAESDCEEGVPDEKAKESFKKSIYKASQTLQESLKKSQKNDNLLLSSKSEIKKQVEIVMNNYKKSVEQAKTDLKLTLSSTTLEHNSTSTKK